MLVLRPWSDRAGELGDVVALSTRKRASTSQSAVRCNTSPALSDTQTPTKAVFGFMWRISSMSRLFASAVILLLASSLGLTKETNPADYTLTVDVSAWQKGSVQTGSHSNDPAICTNPQDAFSKSFCAAYGSHSTAVYSDYADITASIEGTVYTLRGPKPLTPGKYKARFSEGKRHAQTVEFLLEDKKGRPVGVKYYIVGLAATPKQQPEKQ